MTKDEIHLSNFTESLKLSQRMFNLGLLLSFLAIFVAFNTSDVVGQTKIPFVEIPIKSKESFVAITAFFFLSIGFYLSFAIDRCCTTLQLIENKELAEAAKGYPSIVNSSFLYTALMVATLCAAWAITIIETYKIEAIYSIILSQILISPYIESARKSKQIKFQNIQHCI